MDQIRKKGNSEQTVRVRVDERGMGGGTGPIKWIKTVEVGWRSLYA